MRLTRRLCGTAALLLGVMCGWSGLNGPEAVAASDDAVVKTYRTAVSVDPQDVIAQYNLGLALYRIANYPESVQVLEKCLRLNQKDTASHQQVDGPANQVLGIIYFSQLRDNGKAVAAFKRSLEFMPQDKDTYYFLGLALARQKDHAGAIQAFQSAATYGRQQDSELYFQLGLSQAENRQDKEAIKSYQRALELKPDYRDAMENLALLYHQGHEEDQAAQVLQRLVGLDPQNMNANYLLGLYYYRKKMYGEMVKAFTTVVAVKPELADAHYNLGIAYYYQTRYDLAVAALKKAVGLNPKDSEAYTLLGQAQTAAMESHLQQGSLMIAQEQYSDALNEFRQVLLVDPGNHKAKALFDDVEQKLKEETASHLKMAENFYLKKRLEDAYNEYEQTLKLDPSNAQAAAGLAKTKLELKQLLARRIKKAKSAERMQDYREAIRQYEAVLKLKPTDVAARQALQNVTRKLRSEAVQIEALAQRHMKKGDYKTAAKAFKSLLTVSEAVKDETLQERALSGLGLANAQVAEVIQGQLAEGKRAFQQGDAGQAKMSFNRVLELDPQNKVANDYIIKLTGSLSQAKVTAELIKSTYYQGVDYYVKGKIEEAIQEWEKVVLLDPENQDARINIERAQAKLAAIRKLTEGQ